MRSLIQLPTALSTDHAYPLWLVLHGAFSTAEDATRLFGSEATTRHVVLLAPQATRPCGAGYCWSFAHDASAIRTLLDSSSSYFGRNEPTRITARITYSDSSSKKYKATIHHDLNIYKDISYIPEVNENGRSA